MGKIRFMLGRSGTGKTTRCITAAAESLLAEQTTPLILLTPEQATYQMEQMVLAHPGVEGFSRLRVLSFNRLVFWLNRRLRTGTELSRLGRQMVTYRILLEQAKNLSLYHKAARQPGLAERLSGLLAELQQADCTPEQIAELAKQIGTQMPNSTAARKWADIAVVFSAYAAFFEASEALRNPEAELTAARRNVAASPFVRGAHIWVDGFSGFTAQERQILVELARHCDTMHIALCLDPTTLDLDNTDTQTLDPAGLFYTTEQTYADLLGIFRKCRFEVLPPEILNRPLRFTPTPALGHIETALASNTTDVVASKGAVDIVCCPDMRSEAEWAARRICELVRNKGYRYRQIAVAVPDMEQYGAYLESAFARCEIPCFLDRPTTVRHHPLAETLQAALAAARDYCTTDILCFLKSGLTDITNEQIERLEQYCLQYGIEQEDWTDASPWVFAAEDRARQEEAIDQLRKKVVAWLCPLHETLYAHAKSLEAAMFVRAVWNFLEAIDARKQLARWAQDDPTDSQGHRQTWVQLTAVLDEMERVFVGRPEQTDVFVSTLTDALSTLTIKLIPPKLDQVLIGSIERSRHPEIRAMFLLGSTQNQFPIPLSTTDILGQSERQAARQQGVDLAEPLMQQLSKRHYLAYIALTRASEYVAISYPQVDEKGAPVVPSIWLDRVSGLFTDVQPRAAGTQTKILQSQSIAELAERLAAACGKDRPPFSSTDGAAFALHASLTSSHAPIRETAEHVMRALTYTNHAELTNERALDQFKRISVFSASRLKTFAACPYKHFANYILDLEKRVILRFEPLDIGSFYHSVLESLFGQLKQRGLSWSAIPADDLMDLCNVTINQTIQNNPTMTAFMRRYFHHRYIIESSADVLRRFVPVLAEMEKAGQFRQALAEYDFLCTLDTDKDISLKGRIDRLDTAKIDGQTVATIFDFKLNWSSITWDKLFYGLDVQLLIYLLVASVLRNEIQADRVAGAFYLPIVNSPATKTPDEIERLKNTIPTKAKGIFNGQYAMALDKNARKWSQFYNFFVSNDSTPYGCYSKSGALRPEEFDAILSWARHLIGKQVERIRSGLITATPYRLGKQTPCSRCDYKSLCRFDWQINDYNTLAPMDKNSVIEQIKASNESAGTH
ncbi:MAG: hypothetical protein GX298_00015 [Planctomycetes bacterium]|nr:hypothetical protein [Planctomycetota bacterium]